MIEVLSQRNLQWDFNMDNWLIKATYQLKTNFIRSSMAVAFLLATSVQAEHSTSLPNTISGQIKVFDNKDRLLDDFSDVVVFIEGIDIQSENSSKAPVVMSHKNKQFSPRVLPLNKGDVVDFLNDDGIYHNVFSLSKSKPFDLGIYPKGSSKLVPFDKTGLVKIYCNLHPQMISNILVLNNDFYAVTDENGHFAITGLPVGEYTLRIWHELSEEQSHQVKVSTGDNHLEDKTLKLTKRITKHKNKFGKKYKNKY